MNVTFIRHYKLAPPFDKKETISPDQYNQLSRGEIDPSISSDIRDYLKTVEIEELRDYGIIVSSPSKRTYESACAISESLNNNVSVVKADLLKECVWNPELEGSRIQRFIEGTELTNLRDTWKRIQGLEAYLKELKTNKVLCVTHSFFMQVLYLYFFGSFNSYSDIHYEDLKHSFHGDYLKGFTVKFE